MTGGLEDLDTDEPLPARLSRHGFDRLIMLSDGVFAIAITLAALEIRPRGAWATPAELWRALELPLQAYVISFMVIAAYWSAHRDTFARLRRIDTPGTVLTLVVLFFVALLPASTLLLHERGNAALVQVYGVSVLACGFAQAALWAYASFRPALMLEATPVAYRWGRLAATLVMPLYFSWLVLVGVQGVGLAALYGAIVAVIVLLGLRRLVLPRLEGGRRS